MSKGTTWLLAEVSLEPSVCKIQDEGRSQAWNKSVVFASAYSREEAGIFFYVHNICSVAAAENRVKAF